MQRLRLIAMAAAVLVAPVAVVRADEAAPAASNTATPATSSATPADPATTPAAPAGDAKPEEKKDAAPAQEAQSAAAAALLGPPSGLQLTFSWSNNVGTQPESALRYFQTTLQVSANYKLHPKVFLAGAITPFWNLPVNETGVPSNNRGVGLSGGGNFARLNFRNLYKDELTGIAVGGSVTYQLPLAFEDFLAFANPGQGNPRAGALGAALQLFRSVGDVMLIGSVSVNKPLFFFEGAVEICRPTAVTSCSTQTRAGGYNVNYGFGTGLTAIYNLGNFGFVGGLSVATSYTYGPSEGRNPTETALALPANQRFSTSFFLQGGYTINDHLSANIGLFNSGPQIDGGSGYNNPFFDKQYAGVFFGFDYVQ